MRRQSSIEREDCARHGEAVGVPAIRLLRRNVRSNYDSALEEFVIVERREEVIGPQQACEFLRRLTAELRPHLVDAHADAPVSSAEDHSTVADGVDVAATQMG